METNINNKTPDYIKEAYEVVNKYIKYVDQTRINKHDNQPEINAIECAIQNRQSVLDYAIKRLQDEERSYDRYELKQDIESLTKQIEYLRTKI